ncbi:protein DEHYDRATION-INDUCED 19 homolog 4-like [Wolffia australiana]
MDSDLWASRLAAAKRQYALQQQQQQHQSGRLDRLIFDDFDLEEDGRLDFPCPYCYEDHDIASLCFHLEEEHAFESKATVCPICSSKISRDLVNHITIQHGNLFKVQRRRRLRKIAMPNSQVLALLGRDLREAHLQMILGNGATHQSNPPPADSLLSLLSLPPPEPEEPPKSAPVAVDPPKRALPSSLTKKPSFDSSLTREEKEQKMEEAAARATFVGHLVFSTLLGD